MKVLNDTICKLTFTNYHLFSIFCFFCLKATQGSGGWPMSVFLTPELKPFLGGTYFPPEDSFRSPSFLTILTAVHEQVFIYCNTCLLAFY